METLPVVVANDTTTCIPPPKLIKILKRQTDLDRNRDRERKRKLMAAHELDSLAKQKEEEYLKARERIFGNEANNMDHDTTYLGAGSNNNPSSYSSMSNSNHQKYLQQDRFNHSKMTSSPSANSSSTNPPNSNSNASSSSSTPSSSSYAPYTPNSMRLDTSALTNAPSMHQTKKAFHPKGTNKLEEEFDDWEDYRRNAYPLSHPHPPPNTDPNAMLHPSQFLASSTNPSFHHPYHPMPNNMPPHYYPPSYSSSSHPNVAPSSAYPMQYQESFLSPTFPLTAPAVLASGTHPFLSASDPSTPSTSNASPNTFYAPPPPPPPSSASSSSSSSSSSSTSASSSVNSPLSYQQLQQQLPQYLYPNSSYLSPHYSSLSSAATSSSSNHSQRHVSTSAMNNHTLHSTTSGNTNTTPTNAELSVAYSSTNPPPLSNYSSSLSSANPSPTVHDTFSTPAPSSSSSSSSTSSVPSSNARTLFIPSTNKKSSPPPNAFAIVHLRGIPPYPIPPPPTLIQLQYLTLTPPPSPPPFPLYPIRSPPPFLFVFHPPEYPVHQLESQFQNLQLHPTNPTTETLSPTYLRNPASSSSRLWSVKR